MAAATPSASASPRRSIPFCSGLAWTTSCRRAGQCRATATGRRGAAMAQLGSARSCTNPLATAGISTARRSMRPCSMQWKRRVSRSGDRRGPSRSNASTEPGKSGPHRRQVRGHCMPASSSTPRVGARWWRGRERVRRRAFDVQIAAVAVLDHKVCAAELHDATTLIAAAEDGWWYAALLPNRRLAVAWFTDPDLLAASAAWRPSGMVGPAAGTGPHLEPDLVVWLRAARGGSCPGGRQLAADPTHGRRVDCRRRCGRGLRSPLVAWHRERTGGRRLGGAGGCGNAGWGRDRLRRLQRARLRRLRALPLGAARLLRGRAAVARLAILETPPRRIECTGGARHVASDAPPGGIISSDLVLMRVMQTSPY